MHLKRASCQSGDLYEFYRGLYPASSQPPPHSPEYYLAEVGRQMLELMPLLDADLGHQPIWGLTSHDTLCLLPHDDYQAEWLVTVQVQAWRGFRVTYHMPASEAPWADAIVEGIAQDKEQAREFIRIAIRRSCGWTSLP
jgi:hypothetical protein